MGIRLPIRRLCRRYLFPAAFLIFFLAILVYIYLQPLAEVALVRTSLTSTQVALQTEEYKESKSTEIHQPIPHKFEELHFSVKEDVLDPLKVPYSFLLGFPPLQKKYLSIGICSVKRKKENYLMETVKSVFSHLSSSELEEMVLVIYLANFDPALNTEVAEELNRQFGTHVAAGSLVVISCSKEVYPTLEGLKRNYNDPNDRVQYRSKQNVDYALLSNFCANLSQYHLILEDDVHCSKNFLTLIKQYVARISVSWATIAFSKLGYIGKLYHCEHLPKLARFLLMFYDEMPCDWLLDHFYRSQAQTEIIRHKPSLFQHIGSYSSFQDIHNKLKDDDFQEFAGEGSKNPPAEIVTDIEVNENHSLQNAYDGNGFFWGKSVTNGNYILVILKQPVLLKRVHIVTGSPKYGRDVLQSGYVEVGWGTTEESGKVTCKNGTRIGDFSKGKLDADYLNKTITHKVGCLRIQVTKTQLEWILINQIEIWIANS